MPQESRPPAGALRIRSFPYGWALGGLTLLAGVLRFFWLDRPCLWWDEVATFNRAAGTLEALFKMLERDGFVPLHYEIIWLLGRVTPLTPTVMRLVPAATGTLMVPAMYFLAAQLLARRTALLVAAFTACSAYLSFYARDAKMYMPLWLFAALHGGCLFWWLRSNRRLAWLCWIAAGVAMVGLHAAGLLLVLLEPLFFLLARRPRWRTAILFTLGAMLVLAGPAGYYLIFNQWTQRSGGLMPGIAKADPRMGWGNSGLTWLEQYNRGLSGMELTLNTASAFTFGCEWPRQAETPIEHTIPLPWVKPALVAATAITLALLIAGVMPWPKRWRGDAMSPPESSAPLLPGWRILIVLAAWLVLPTYGLFYCRSFLGFVSPGSWLQQAAAMLGWWWLALVPGVAVVTRIAARRPLARGACMFVAGVGLPLAAGLCFIIWQTPRAGEWAQVAQGRPLWMLLLLLSLPALWLGAGEDAAQRRGQVLRLLAAAALIWGLCLAAYWGWQWAWQVAQLGHPKLVWQSIWFPRYLGVIWPALALGIMALLMRLPTRPLRWMAVALLLGLNTANSLARILAQTEPPLDRIAADIVSAKQTGADVRVVMAGRGGRRGNWMAPIWGRYYLGMAEGRLSDPAVLAGRSSPREFGYLVDPSPASLQAIAKETNPCRRLIVWERFPRGFPATSTPDAVTTALGASWEMAALETWQARQARGWRGGDWYRRREFSRKSPASEPSVGTH